MRKRDLRIDDVLDRGFTQHGEPSHEQMAADLARVRERLDPTVARVPVPSALRRKPHTPRLVASAFRRKAVQLATAVLVMAAAVGTAILWRADDTALYRIVEGDVRVGQTIRSNGGGGAVLELADTSRIEMRSHTELSLDRADDGLRIRLNAGGIIVNAAKQRTGHLYVQTRDMTVSVVGTVFVVNADEEGSRVAVIEGEVRVQQGATETKLRPGERVASSPKVETFSVASELAWSRRAESWLSLLQQQSAAVSNSVATQKPEARVEFEVESIRPRPAAAGGGGRGSGVLPNGFPPACGASLKIDPRRFLATNITAFELITLAYDKDCQFAEEHPEAAGVTGGPDWIRSARFDVEALRFEDRSDYTTRVLAGGMSEFTPGPKLRRLLQTLLAQRFGLVMRHEMKETAIYELRVANTGPKLTPSKESEGGQTYLGVGLYDAIRNGISDKPAYAGLIVGAISGRRLSMTELAERLARMTTRPVFDRTGVEGEFTFEFFFAPAQFRAWRRNPADPRPQLPSPSLFTALEEELGLRLEESKQQVEFLVVERVDRPTEN